jgi:hypothetical protein
MMMMKKVMILFKQLIFFPKGWVKGGGGWLIASGWIDCLLLLSYLVSKFWWRIQCVYMSYKCLFFFGFGSQKKKDEWEASFPQFLVALWWYDGPSKLVFVPFLLVSLLVCNINRINSQGCILLMHQQTIIYQYTNTRVVCKVMRFWGWEWPILT